MALAELAAIAVLSTGPTIDENARPAPRGMVALRLDVELSDPPQDGER